MNITIHFKEDGPTIQALTEELLLEYYHMKEMGG